MTQTAGRAAATSFLARPSVLLAFFMPPLFLSALLMFWSQPLIGKMILPLLGGTPMVWSTCMVFFQALLLAGYGYAHVSLKLGVRRQALLHIALLLVSLIALPIGFDAARWEPPTSDNPMGWLFVLLAASAGAPFFMLAATAPMLQSWFARTDHPDAADPYFLYVTSNIGSFIGLLGFPAVAEVFLTIPGQTSTWSALYLLLVAAIALAALKTRGMAAGAPKFVPKSASEGGRAAAGTSPTAALRLRWVLLAFVPSSLFIGLTTYVTTDIAAVPLLWILPLAGYLLTFIIAFARKPIIPHARAVLAQPYLMLPVIMMFFVGGEGGSATWFTIGLHFLAFFIAALVCHGELARTRPNAEHLTEFYFMLSLGGVLGGIFNAIVAPVAFTSLLEYPLVLVLALFLRPGGGENVPRPALKDFVLPLAVFVPLLFALWRFHDVFDETSVQMTMAIVLSLICMSAAGRPWRLGLTAAAVLLAATAFPIGDRSNVLKAERNFFGIIRVVKEDKPPMMTMYHGTTNHGSQSLEPGKNLVPQTYYFPGSPLTQVFQFPAVKRAGANLSVLGLGTGAISCMARKGQVFTYYEIDPAVERMARDESLFGFMRDCPPTIKVVLGDGRLTLQKMPNASQDLLVMDAFTSDAVPVHLLTREALAMYLTKLKADGVLVYHISNRYLDLAPVLTALAADAGLNAFIQEYDAPASDPSAFGSTWVVMARPGPSVDHIRADGRWVELKNDAKQRLWTDNFSNIVTALKW